MKGYKYVAWDIDEHNSSINLSKAARHEIVHFSELKTAKGYYDKEFVNGIHFCRTQHDLIQWVKDCFEWEDPSCIEILEVIPVAKVRQRKYGDGRTAFITESCYVRVLEDDEIDSELLQIIHSHFG